MYVCTVCMYVFVTFTGVPLQPLHIAAVSGVPQLHQPIPYIHTSHTHMINFTNANTYYLMYVCMCITSCGGDSLLRGRENGVIHRSRVRNLEPAHVEPFH